MDRLGSKPFKTSSLASFRLFLRCSAARLFLRDVGVRRTSTLGLHDQAARVRELVRTELPDHKLPGTIALYMQLALAWPELMYGDFEAAGRYAAEHVAFCVERKVEQFRLWGGNYQAAARAMREPTEENVAAWHGAIAANNRSGGYFSDSIFKSYLAEALLMRGEIAGAEAALQDALAFVERSGERFWLADLYRVDGQIALRRPETDRAGAEACFLKAIEIAHGQEARMLDCAPPLTLAGYGARQMHPTILARCSSRSSL